MRVTEKDFLLNIQKLVNNDASRESISKEALDMMNLSINWRSCYRDFALDLIYSIEPQFELTDEEIMNRVKQLEKIL
ncbi:hypothetical protein [Lonepinella sp. MS14436]|uniref:hypothetical protein n=1 Tax=Lonepinella sp. MS14436 TaxID=3003619 RepID=UPI0036DCD522